MVLQGMGSAGSGAPSQMCSADEYNSDLRVWMSRWSCSDVSLHVPDASS